MKSVPIYAHPFTEERYWHGSEVNCTRRLFTRRKTSGMEENGQLKGFCQRNTEAWFCRGVCRPDALRHGIGKALLEYVQQRFPLLSLEVYLRKSTFAVNLPCAWFSAEDSASAGGYRPPHWI